MSVRLAERWLTVACWITLATGLVALGGSHPSTQGGWVLLLDAARWPIDGQPATLEPVARALSAIIGGLMLGWGSMMLFARRLPAPPYALMTRALLIWCVADSAGSVVAGLPGNVVINALFLAVFLVPLTRLQRPDA